MGFKLINKSKLETTGVSNSAQITTQEARGRSQPCSREEVKTRARSLWELLWAFVKGSSHPTNLKPSNQPDKKPYRHVGVKLGAGDGDEVWGRGMRTRSRNLRKQLENWKIVSSFWRKITGRPAGHRRLCDVTVKQEMDQIIILHIVTIEDQTNVLKQDFIQEIKDQSKSENLFSTSPLMVFVSSVMWR